MTKFHFYLSGDPLYVGFDLTIASFDSISEVSMVSNTRKREFFMKQNKTFSTSCLYTNFLRLNYNKEYNLKKVKRELSKVPLSIP